MVRNSLDALCVTQLGLVEYIIPNNVRNEVADAFDRFLDISTVLLDLRSDKLHDSVSALLACFKEQTRRHFVD